ncbi:thioredoxin family protein [Hydrogenophaga sp.]|uniref:thioredoxin family protein n=1 Tax=Hydrogenophaga sp. TaxID=1904254 RepID=UPI00356A4C2C
MQKAAGLIVIGLCAQWCGTCRDYLPVFDALAKEEPDQRFVWLDIEDEADLVANLEVETFPTLVIGLHDQLLFAGPVLPRLSDARRLLAALWEAHMEGEAPAASRLLPDQRRDYLAIVRHVINTGA